MNHKLWLIIWYHKIKSTFGDEKGIGLTISFISKKHIGDKFCWLETLINCSIFSLLEFESFWFGIFRFFNQKFTPTCQSRIWDAFEASYIIWFPKIFWIFQQNIKWNIIMFISDLVGWFFTNLNDLLEHQKCSFLNLFFYIICAL